MYALLNYAQRFGALANYNVGTSLAQTYNEQLRQTIDLLAVASAEAARLGYVVATDKAVKQAKRIVTQQSLRHIPSGR